MPYARPTLTALNQEALEDIQAANLQGVDGLLQRAVLRVLARAQSGLAYEHYGYQDWIAQQAVPWTAQGEYLTGWAALKAVFQKPATAATLTVAFTGAVGTDLPAGEPMSTLNSLSFASTGDAKVAANETVTVTVTSQGTGSAYNLAAGTQITLSNAIAGINSTGSVIALQISGADLETEDDFRTRMLQVYANPPQGGAASDYETWALAVPGVTRAWCNPNGAGPGTVVVYVMLDDAEAANAGFPQGSAGVATSEPRAPAATGDLLTVVNAIYPLQPVTALVSAVSPSAMPINFAIANLAPASSAIQVAIQAALADLFLRIGSPLGMTLYPSDWEGAVNSVAGIEHFNVTSPSGPVTLALGQLPTVGTVTVSA